MKQEMPLPKSVGPKDMSFATYQFITALNKQLVITRIIAVYGFIVGSLALVLVAGIMRGYW